MTSKWSLTLLAGILTLSLVGTYLLFRSPTCSLVQQHTPSSELIVGTSADFPPFAFIRNDEMVGFDIDIIHEIGRHINKKVVIKDMPFEMLLPQLQLGSLHVIAAGLTATPERAQRVLFTQPYLSGDSLVVVISKNNKTISTFDDLKHKDVVVNDGYTADTFMSAQAGINLKRLPSVTEALLALSAGRADAFVTAYNTVKPLLENQGHTLAFFAIPNTAENTALAISKQYPELLPLLQQALDAMEQEGVIKELKKKWNIS